MKLLIITILSGTMFLASCSFPHSLSVEKRRYRQGFYIDLNNNKARHAEAELTVNDKPETTNTDTLKPAQAVANVADSAVCNNVAGPDGDKANTEFFAKKTDFRSATDQAKKGKQFFGRLKTHCAVLKKGKAVAAGGDDSNKMLCIIVALFFPALGLYLFEGNSGNFRLALIIGCAALLCFVLAYILAVALIFFVPAVLWGLGALLFLANKIFAVVKIANSGK
ncbi:MAG: hypothetical protein MUC87_21905 [Bacteroidia bacterium]|jgi:hypothetical protein|nr:hypothetical protein [Bacteroidia bacterium]